MSVYKMELGGFFRVIGIVLLAGCIWVGEAADDPFDVVIRNAMVLDGSIRPAFRADVAIRGETIVKVAPQITDDAKRILDAQGLYLAPGFIDLHTHAERNMFYPEHRAALNYLKQGVTSLIVGQCGQSGWPLVEKAVDQIQRWRKSGIGPNAAMLVGHGTVREIVMGMEDRAPTQEEMERMKELVREAMRQGASGLSTGLIYLPGRYAETDEIVELVSQIAPFGGIYHTHIRNERDKLLDAVQEAIEVSRKTDVRTHISHFKVMGRANWGLVKRACSLIEKARAEGLSITADQYPFRFANGNPYRPLIPAGIWRGRGGPDRFDSDDVERIFNHVPSEELIEFYRKMTPIYPLSANHERFLTELPRDRLVDYVGSRLISSSAFRGPENPRERMLFLQRYRDPVQKNIILKGVHEYIENLVGFEDFVVGICNEEQYEGLNLVEVAEQMGKSPAEAAVELELMGAQCIPMQMHESDIITIMGKDYVGTGSDGVCPNYGLGSAHIRAYVTFLHKIQEYVLERKAVSLPHVIRSQTSLPAGIMNWRDRGWIKPGYKADITVFDLGDLGVRATISNPHRYSAGVRYLLINGKVVLDHGIFTGELPGRVLLLEQ